MRTSQPLHLPCPAPAIWSGHLLMDQWTGQQDESLVWYALWMLLRRILVKYINGIIPEKAQRRERPFRVQGERGTEWGTRRLPISRQEAVNNLEYVWAEIQIRGAPDECGEVVYGPLSLIASTWHTEDTKSPLPSSIHTVLRVNTDTGRPPCDYAAPYDIKWFFFHMPFVITEGAATEHPKCIYLITVIASQ